MYRTLIRAAATALALAAAPAGAVDFNEQFLAAACTPAQPNRALTAVDANGVGVRHRPGSTRDVILYCQIDAAESNYFNWLQLIAADDTPDGYARATLWRTNILAPAAPEALYTVTTSDQAGVQTAVNAGLDGSLNEYQYAYWIELRLVRSDPDASVVVYATALMDVF
jgi:hypothetical protein